MVWWNWLLLGLVLLAAEVAAPGGFYILFFGVSALIIGALAGLEWINTPWLQWLLFSILSIISLFLFRNSLLAWTKSHEPVGQAVDSLVGDIAIVTEDVPPGEQGKAELRGTAWSVRNVGHAVLEKGHRARVERVEGLTLWISSDDR